MVFPSVNPLYLDPPTWNQQLQQQQQQQILIQQQHQQLQPAAAPSVGPDGGNPEPGPPRANSMAERARAAKIPHPEQALRCPRCDSTNTKFCYFNNYSLSQPRHFCKACRRYWTRGGALRNVPVGGGTRRNKRSSSSKKPSSSSSNTTSTSAAPAADATHGQLGASSSSTAMSAGADAPPLFMSSLHHPMMDYGLASGSNIGLGFSGLDPVEQQEQQWRVSSQIQQFPFLGGLGLDPHQGIHYPSSTGNFDNQGGGAGGTAAGVVGPTGSDLISSQMASVKMEEQHARGGQRYNINSLGMNNVINPRSDQFWSGGGSGSNGNNGSGTGGSGGGGWMTNLSGFNSSSTGSLL